MRRTTRSTSVARVTDAPQQPPQIAVNLPPEQEIGVFADFAAVWHNPTSFVLDFLSPTARVRTREGGVVQDRARSRVAPTAPPVPGTQGRGSARARAQGQGGDAQGRAARRSLRAEEVS